MAQTHQMSSYPGKALGKKERGREPMADSKTDDDDDEGFGEFTFAQFGFNPKPIASFSFSSDKTNGSKWFGLVPEADNDDGDEWGDFVESHLRSNGASETQSHIHDFESSKSFDTLGFVSDQSAKPLKSLETHVQLERGRVDSETKDKMQRVQTPVQWVKPGGALPLSIFGDLEAVEDGSGDHDPQVGYDKDAFSGTGFSFNGKTGSNVIKGVGLDDIIANLYDQSSRVNDGTWPTSSSNGSKWNSNSSASNLSAIDLDSDAKTSGRKDLDVMRHFPSNGFSLLTNGMDSDMKTSNLSTTQFTSEFMKLNIYSNDLSSNSNNQRSNSDLNLNEQNWSFVGSNPNSIENITSSNGFDMGVKTPSSIFDELNFHNLNALDKSKTTERSNPSSLVSDYKESKTDSQSVVRDRCDVIDDDYDDDDGWEFQDAYSEMKHHDGKDEGHDTLKATGFEVQWTTSPETQVEERSHEVFGGTTHSSAFGLSSNKSIDLFGQLNEIKNKSYEGFDLNLNAASQNSDSGFELKLNGFVQNSSSISYFCNETKDANEMTTLHSACSFVDFDENFGDFEAASSENELKREKETKVNGLLHSEVKESIFDGKNQGSSAVSDSHERALPLSIFGDEELEADGSLNLLDDSMFQPAHFHAKMHNEKSSISINDFISNLYNESGQTSHASFERKAVENGLDPVDLTFDSNITNDDNDDDDDDLDDSWEFKDAVSQNEVENQIFNLSDEGIHQTSPSKLHLNSYLDFYSKLKDELCFVVKHHLDVLKKGHNSVALCDEDTDVTTLDEDIQKCCKELQQGNISFDEGQLVEDCSSQVVCLQEFVQALHGPKFQLLESEYHLSRSLSLAEKDFRSAVDLIKHTTSILRIVKLGSEVEQSQYVSSWSKIIFVCAQELKHGAWIWKQSSEKHIQSNILSDPRGKRFVLALGEIYRVVVILEACAKLYKPWILLWTNDSMGFLALLEQCHDYWSTSELEEALLSISDEKYSDSEVCFSELMDSIKYIRDLDSSTLENLVFDQQELVCQLSVLTEGVVPGMKITLWNGKHYFVALANLWANLISCDPPELPQLHAFS